MFGLIKHHLQYCYTKPMGIIVEIPAKAENVPNTTKNSQNILSNRTRFDIGCLIFFVEDKYKRLGKM